MPLDVAGHVEVSRVLSNGYRACIVGLGFRVGVLSVRTVVFGGYIAVPLFSEAILAII